MSARDWQQAKQELGQLAAMPRFGLFSDLDGTLAPIAPTPETAAITPRNRELLAELAAALPVVGLISGRRAASLQAKVNLPGLIYVGNHGLEQWVDGRTVPHPQAAEYRSALEAARARIEALLPQGALAEDKGVTLSIHYRQTRNPAEFLLSRGVEIKRVVEEHGLVLFPGKMVLEVRPPVKVDKGTALRDVVQEWDLEAALFLGDDISDLQAFAAARALRAAGRQAWGVGVRSQEAPAELAEAADYLAAGVADVEALLEFVLMARKASST